MQPGSLGAKVGDKVVTGQVLGVLGIAEIPTRRIFIFTSWTARRRFFPQGSLGVRHISRVNEDGNTLGFRYQLMQKLQPLCLQLVGEQSLD